MANIIKINGTWFNPSEMSIGVMSIQDENAGRDQSGTMYFRLVAVKQKIQLAWWCPSPELTSEILTAVKPSHFNVTYTDPVTNTQVTKDMYVGDREAPVQMWGSNRKFYSRVAFDLIER